MKTHYVGKKLNEGKKKYITLKDASSTSSKQDQSQREIQFQKYKRYYSSLSMSHHAWQYISKKSNTTNLYQWESDQRFDYNGKNKKHYYTPISFLSKCSRFGKVNLQPQTSHTGVGIHLVNCLLYQPFHQVIQWNRSKSMTLLQGNPYPRKCTRIDFESSQDISEDQPILSHKDGLTHSLKLPQNVTHKVSHNISRLVAAVHHLCDSLKGYNCMVLRMLEQRMKHGDIEHSSVTESISDKIFLSALGYRHTHFSFEDSIVIKPLKKKSLVVMLNKYIDENCSNEQGQLCIDKSLQEKIRAVDSVSKNGLILKPCADENSSLGSSQIKGSKSSNESTSLGENQSDDHVQNTDDTLEFFHPVQYNASAVTKELLQQLHQKMQTETVLNDLSFYRVVRDFYNIALQCREDSELTGESEPSDLVDGSINSLDDFPKELNEISYDRPVTSIPETSRNTVKHSRNGINEENDEESLFSFTQNDRMDSSSIHENPLSVDSIVMHKINETHGKDAIKRMSNADKQLSREFHKRVSVTFPSNKEFCNFGVVGNCVLDTISMNLNDILRGPHKDPNIACLVKEKDKVDSFFAPKAHELKEEYLNNTPSNLLNESSSNSIQELNNDEFNTRRRESKFSIVPQGSSDKENIGSKSSVIKATYTSVSPVNIKDNEKTLQQNKESGKTPLNSQGHDFVKFADKQKTDSSMHEDSHDGRITLNIVDTNLGSTEVSHTFEKSTLTENSKSSSQSSSGEKQFGNIKFKLPDEAVTYSLSEDDEEEGNVLNDEAPKKMLTELENPSRQTLQTDQEVERTVDTGTIGKSNALSVEPFDTRNELGESIPIAEGNNVGLKTLIIPTGEAERKLDTMSKQKEMQNESLVEEANNDGITSDMREDEMPCITPIVIIHPVEDTTSTERDNNEQQRSSEEEAGEFKTTLFVPKEDTWKTRRDVQPNDVWDTVGIVGDDKVFKTSEDGKVMKPREKKPFVSKDEILETRKECKEMKALETKPVVTEGEHLETDLDTQEVKAWERTHAEVEDKLSESMRDADEIEASEAIPEINVSENHEVKLKEDDSVAFQQEKQINKAPAVLEAKKNYKEDEDEKADNKYSQNECDALPCAEKNEETIAVEKNRPKDLPSASKDIRNVVQGIHDNDGTIKIVRGNDMYKTKKVARRYPVDWQGEKKDFLNQQIKKHEYIMKNGIILHAKEAKKNYIQRLKQDVSKQNQKMMLKKEPKFYGKEKCVFDDTGGREEEKYELGHFKGRTNLLCYLKKTRPLNGSLKDVLLDGGDMKKTSGNEGKRGFPGQQVFSSNSSYEKKGGEWCFQINDSNESDKGMERKKTILRCDSRNMNGMMQTYRYGIRKELLRAVRAQNLKGMKKCILEMENLLQQAEKRLTYQEEDLALEREKKVLLEKRVEEGDKQIENLQEQVTKLITLLRTKEKDRMVCLRKLEELNSYVCDMEKQYRISLTELQEAHEKDKKKLQTTTKLLQNVTTCQEMYEKENRILKNKIIKYESQMSCGDIILSQRAALLQELTTRMERKLAYIEVLETQKDAYQKLVSSLNDTFSKTSYWPREAQMIKDTLQKVQDQNYNCLCEKLERTLTQLHQKSYSSSPEK